MKDNVRHIGIVGHIGAGKTTLSAAMIQKDKPNIIIKKGGIPALSEIDLKAIADKFPAGNVLILTPEEALDLGLLKAPPQRREPIIELNPVQMPIVMQEGNSKFYTNVMNSRKRKKKR